MQCFKIADDDRKQVVEVMSHAAGESANPFHFLRLQQPLFGRASFGEIAGHLGETYNLAGRITECVHKNACPEARTILTDAPALRFVFSGTRSGFKDLVGNTVAPILLGVEARKMLPDNLLAFIPLDVRAPGFQFTTVPVGSSM